MELQPGMVFWYIHGHQFKKRGPKTNLSVRSVNVFTDPLGDGTCNLSIGEVVDGDQEEAVEAIEDFLERENYKYVKRENGTFLVWKNE